MTRTSAAAEALATRLTTGALPGELIGFGDRQIAAAAAFVAATAGCGWRSSTTTCPSWSIRSPPRSASATSP